MAQIREAQGALIGARVRHVLPRLLSAIPVIMIPALEWLPSISDGLRPWLIIGSLAVAGLGIWWSAKRERRSDELQSDYEKLREGLERAEPEYLLQQVASTIFRQGAWRLTVYRKARDSSSELGDHLVRVASVASDGDEGSLGPQVMPIRPATLFQHLFLSNLADSRYRRAEQSGAFGEDLHSSAWITWRDGIFGAPSAAEEPEPSPGFRARKFVWYAAQEPRSQRVFVVIAESAEIEGIVVDYIDHVLTPAWLFFVSRLSELRSQIDQ